MSDNQSQPNNNDFISDFDFDDSDILIKDEGGKIETLKQEGIEPKKQDKETGNQKLEIGGEDIEISKQNNDIEPEIEASHNESEDSKSKNPPNTATPEPENKKSGGFLKNFFGFNKKKEGEEKKEAPISNFVWIGEAKEPVKHPSKADSFLVEESKKPSAPDAGKQKIKKAIKPFDTAQSPPQFRREDKPKNKKTSDDLLKQAEWKKDRFIAQSQEGEGLVFNEEDEEEIEKFKKKPLINSYPDAGVLAQRLLRELKIVSGLKIDLIVRLKNIIDSYLRDIRNFIATKELLQRPVEKSGLNLTLEQAKQIMIHIKKEYEKIHSVTLPTEQISTPPTTALNLKPDLVISKSGLGFSAGTEPALPPTSLPSVKISQTKKIKTAKHDDIISKKTARETQLGIFSDEVATKKQKNKKTQNDERSNWDIKCPRKQDSLDKLDKWEKELAIPDKLRTPEISAPDAVKKITAGGLKPAEKILKQSLWSKIFLGKQKTCPVPRYGSDKGIGGLTPKHQLDRGSKSPRGALRAFDNAPLKQSASPQKDRKILPRVSRVQQKTDERPKIEDIKIVKPPLVGPVEELEQMTLSDFRRLGPTIFDSIEKIKQKIKLASQDSFNQKIACINGWRKGQPNQLYLKLGRQSLLHKIPVVNLINQYKLEQKTVLTKEEFDLINGLNKDLRY